MFRFAIETYEELRDGVVRNFQEQFNYITHQAEIPDTIDTSVHEIRKSFKRIRAILRLIRWDIGEDLYHSENRKFRDLSRSLSSLRDYHVIICDLAERFESEELLIPESRFIQFINHLNDQKELEYQHLVDIKAMKTIQHTLKQSYQDVQGYDLSRLGPHTIEKGVKHIYQNCLNHIEKAQHDLTDASLHNLRKCTKYLLYQMQLVEEVWPDYFNNYSKALKEATDLLGDDHNLVEEITIINSMPESLLPQTDKQRLTDALNKERQQLHEETWQLMGKIFTEDPNSFIKRVNSYWLLGRQTG